MLMRLISLCCFFFVFCVFANAADFSNNGDGTVTDMTTGLMWQQSDDNIIRTWQQSLDYCNGLSFAGKNDWRLPNIKELESIVDDTVSGPAINTIYFPVTNVSYSSYYWSSTSYQTSTAGAFRVGIYLGGVMGGLKSSLYYARCVR